MDSNTPTPAAAGDDKKRKKKKKKKLSQKMVDQVWERFSQKRFTMVISVLPPTPGSPAALSEHPNESTEQAFQRVTEMCRQKVRRIIQDCRRDNVCYRDPHWDIELDLKQDKGNCLNGLVYCNFSLHSETRVESQTAAPKAVKRVKEIFERPTFLEHINESDTKQGKLGNCWFISAAGCLASKPEIIERVCVEYDQKVGIYGFVFYRDGEWISSIIDDKLYLTSPCWDAPSSERTLLNQIDREDPEKVYCKTYQTGSKALFFAKNKDENETWMPLLEKAYAKVHGDYSSLVGGWLGEGIEDLTGGVTTELLVSDICDTDDFWNEGLARVKEEFFFGCSTGVFHDGLDDRDGITESHAYSIMEARTLQNGTRLLKIRNPWGKATVGTWKGAWSDGSSEWTPEIQRELGHTFGRDSLFWMSYEDFLAKFQEINRTRLFRDPSWRCSQRWAAVDVPWRPAYREQFRFRLAQPSPLVLVLSQLDHRYFEGLTGLYRFRLHFRLQAVDLPAADDYLVRSQPTYHMMRSISVDLPLLEAGSYAVFVSVEARRPPGCCSVEKMVKSALRKRTDHAKLLQVGQAYDYAHGKAAAHMAELAEVRKRQDQGRAAEERRRGRRRAWEKRHLLARIHRRQEEKNEAKRARREQRRQKEEGANIEQTNSPQQPETAEVSPATIDSSPSASPIDTPTASVASEAGPKKEPGREAKGQKKGRKSRRAAESEDDMSDSPVEDWEMWYSSDDLSTKASRKGLLPPIKLLESEDEASEEEQMPEPWNAICVVGIRVYSKDEDLKLGVVMEDKTSW